MCFTSCGMDIPTELPPTCIPPRQPTTPQEEVDVFDGMDMALEEEEEEQQQVVLQSREEDREELRQAQQQHEEEEEQEATYKQAPAAAGADAARDTAAAPLGAAHAGDTEATKAAAPAGGGDQEQAGSGCDEPDDMTCAICLERTELVDLALVKGCEHQYW